MDDDTPMCVEGMGGPPTSMHGEVVSHRMLCCAEGKKDMKHIENPLRQREHRALT